MLPFPYPIRIGTDICQISRIRRILTSRNGTRFLERIFSVEERTAFAARLKPAFEAAEKAASLTDKEAHQTQPRGQVARDVPFEDAMAFVAGRFAAKEAAFKAHSTYRLGFHDVHIMARRLVLTPGETKPRGSAPYAIIQARPPFTHVAQEAQVSISHDGGYATAVCLGFEQAQAHDDQQQDGQTADEKAGGHNDGQQSSQVEEQQQNQTEAPVNSGHGQTAAESKQER